MSRIRTCKPDVNSFAVEPVQADAAGRFEADHRIANSLASLAAILRLESRRIDTVEGARQALASASGRLRAISRVHVALTRTDRRGEIDLGEHLGKLAEDLSEGLDADVRTDCDGLKVSADLAGGLAIILSELATNAVKHNPGRSSRLVITLDAKRIDGKELRIEVRDDGDGFPDGFDPANSRGLGMAIIGSTVSRFDGTLETGRAGAGAEFVLRFP